jgi:hypothetical protein
MKWTVLIGDRELPARPLVLEAAGVAPNDPINSHQAVEILKRLGFETRYCKEPSEMQATDIGASSGNPSSSSVLEMVLSVTEKIPENEWQRIPADLSKNVDHYLYGTKKADK